MTETCATCRYWRKAGTGWGRCHRSPPVRTSSLDSGWPQANDDHWCGEHRPAEQAAEGDAYTRAAVAYAEAEAACILNAGKDKDGHYERVQRMTEAGAAFRRLYRERHDAQR